MKIDKAAPPFVQLANYYVSAWSSHIFYPSLYINLQMQGSAVPPSRVAPPLVGLANYSVSARGSHIFLYINLQVTELSPISTL
ncbi:unnamed protein product [Urochloa humidicola]